MISSLLLDVFSYRGVEEIVILVLVADIQPVVVRHDVSQRDGLSKLHVEQCFHDVVLRSRAHASGDALPIVQKRPKIVAPENHGHKKSTGTPI